MSPWRSSEVSTTMRARDRSGSGIDAFAQRGAIHVMHLVVDQHDFERMLVVERLAHHAQRFFATARETDLVACVHQLSGEHASIGFVIVHHQHAAAESREIHGYGHLVCAAGSSGSTNQKVEPLPSSLSTPTSPPIISTSRRTIDRPRPVPPK